MKFVAIDLETANARMHTICQAGIVVFEHGREIASEVRFVDPRDYFDGMNVGIHGIREEDVIGAATFDLIHPWISDIVHGEIVICHTHFDRVAFKQACDFHSLEHLPCRWIDTARVARRAWPERAGQGYGLRVLADAFGITFRHHDALEDARAAAQIFHRAIEHTGRTPEDWFVELAKPRKRTRLGGDKRTSIERDASDGPLSDHVFAFTGALSMPRQEAASLANDAGAAVDSGVTKDTTILVVGDQDLDRLRGKEKSAKHAKAEAMAGKGHPIRIMQESDFMALISEIKI